MSAVKPGRCAGRVEAVRAAYAIVVRLLDETPGQRSIRREDVVDAVREIQRLAFLAPVEHRKWSR